MVPDHRDDLVESARAVPRTGGAGRRGLIRARTAAGRCRTAGCARKDDAQRSRTGARRAQDRGGSGRALTAAQACCAQPCCAVQRCSLTVIPGRRRRWKNVAPAGGRLTAEDGDQAGGTERLAAVRWAGVRWRPLGDTRCRWRRSVSVSWATRRCGLTADTPDAKSGGGVLQRRREIERERERARATTRQDAAAAVANVTRGRGESSRGGGTRLVGSSQNAAVLKPRARGGPGCRPPSATDWACKRGPAPLRRLLPRPCALPGRLNTNCLKGPAIFMLGPKLGWL